MSNTPDPTPTETITTADVEAAFAEANIMAIVEGLTEAIFGPDEPNLEHP